MDNLISGNVLLDSNFFNEDLMNLQDDNTDNFESVIQTKPRRPRIKYRFCIAS